MDKIYLDYDSILESDETFDSIRKSLCWNMPHNEGNRICFICESHYKELISDEDNKDLANVFLTAHRAHRILATYFYQYSIIRSTKNISKELVCSKKE